MKKYIWLVIIVICFTAFSAGILVGRNTSGEPINITEAELKQEKPMQSTVERDNKKININTASEKSLSELRGIGDTLAKRIVEYRTYNGEFNTIDDIKNVTGIGDKLFDNIKDDITV